MRAAAPDGTAPVLDAEAVLQRAEWAQPRMARRFSSLIRGVLAEAEMLGLIGSGALSQLGSAIAAGHPDDAMDILGEHLPAALNHVLLQADLTAVAPGYLAPELSEQLLLMADAEGQGPATIYRFSAASIRRALDAGQDAAASSVSCASTRPPRFRSRWSIWWRTPPPGTAGCASARRRASSRATMKPPSLELAGEAKASGAGPGPDRPHRPDFHRTAAAKLPRSCAGWDFRPPSRNPSRRGPAEPHHAAPRQRPPGVHRAADGPADADVDAQLAVLRSHAPPAAGWPRAGPSAGRTVVRPSPAASEEATPARA